MISPTAAFAKTLASLNDEQRAAVEGIHGPWMVLAGPGTGKTHMLAARIGNILLTEQIEPRNILCLTFTNAGVKAMRDRLVRFLGAPGSRVAVHTFHDFARQVIEESPQLFDYIAWEQTDALDRHRLVNALIDGLPPKHPLRGPVHEPYAEADKLLWLFDKMAQESWSVEAVVAAANHHVADLPNLAEYVYQRRHRDKQPGDLKPAAAEQAAKMERLIAAAELAPRYAALKRDRGLYDYADQLGWLYRALDDHPELRMQLQERFPFILVDEFQDTNGIQHEILGMLAEDERPNLFVVGDDDQSIYGFQGARVAGLERHVERLRPEGLSVVVLRANYRSHDAILRAAEQVISINRTRLTAIADQPLEKVLIESSRFAERPHPRVCHYPTALAQAHYTAEQIATWLAGGVPADEVAVIYRTHAQSARLIESLEQQGIPYRLQRSINVLQHPFIRSLRHALAFIAKLRGDRAVDMADVYEFLQAPAIGLQLHELDAINAYRFNRRRGVPAWRYLMMHPELLEGEDVPVAAADRLRAATALLDELGALIDRYPLGTLVQQVAQRTGLLRAALGGEERALALECIDALVRDAGARVRKTPTLTLAELVALWDEMDAYDLPLSLVKQADTRAAVTLMTAHAAKGLEFDCVVMYDVTGATWEANRAPTTHYTLPPELSFELDKSAREEENRRLFYVALTRARREVVLTVADETEAGRANSPAVALEELVTEGLATQERPAVDDEALYGALEQYHSRPLPPSRELLDPAAAREALAEAPLTLRAINEFARCRLSYVYRYVRGVTAAKSPRERYQEVIHESIREHYAGGVRSEDRVFAPEDELVATFQHGLSRHRGGLDAAAFTRYLEEGEAALRAWHRADDVDPRTFEVLLEQRLTLDTDGGLPLSGRIDRADRDRDTQLWVPVDYKFGEAPTIPTGVSRHDKRPKCLDYWLWRQLAFYALLLRDGRNGGLLPPYGKIVYLSPKGTTVERVNFDPGLLSTFEEELRDTYTQMQTCDDFTGCLHDDSVSERDKGKCSWCNFHYLKRNGVEFASDGVKALDD